MYVAVPTVLVTVKETLYTPDAAKAWVVVTLVFAVAPSPKFQPYPVMTPELLLLEASKWTTVLAFTSDGV